MFCYFYIFYDMMFYSLLSFGIFDFFWVVVVDEGEFGWYSYYGGIVSFSDVGVCVC